MVLVISNPAAKRAGKQMALIEALRGIEHVKTQSPDSVSDVLNRFGPGPNDLIVAHGGDGTFAHLATTVIKRYPSVQRPQLACLPGGTTNMTAAGFNDSRTLKRCLRSLEAGRGCGVQRQALVRARSGALDVSGVFFGVGAIVEGIRFFQRRRAEGSASSEGAVVRALLGIVRGEAPYGRPLTLGRDGENVAVLLLLATTLERLLLGARPFWGKGSGALRVTEVAHPPKDFLPALCRMAAGREPAAKGYHSWRADALRLKIAEAFTIDGELYDPPSETVTLEAEWVRLVSL